MSTTTPTPQDDPLGFLNAFLNPPLTVPAAARLLHYSRKTVLKMLKDGQLQGSKSMRRWLIPPESVHRLIETRTNAAGSSFGEFFDPLYQPDLSIPVNVQEAIDLARARLGDWEAVGTALGEHMLDLWPDDRCLGGDETGIDAMATAMYSKFPNQTMFTIQMCHLVWLNFRFPSVMEEIPEDEILAVVKAAVIHIFN